MPTTDDTTSAIAVVRLHVASDAEAAELVRVATDLHERVRVATERDAITMIALVLHSNGATETPAFRAKLGRPNAL